MNLDFVAERYDLCSKSLFVAGKGVTAGWYFRGSWTIYKGRKGMHLFQSLYANKLWVKKCATWLLSIFAKYWSIF